MTRSREDFTVQILRNGSGAPAGAGFVVDETHIVTCAHVVNTALGRRKREQDPPDPGTRIRVTLPMLDGGDGAPTLSCVVQTWMPPPASGVSGGDVAGLVVDGDGLPKSARAARLADYREFRDAEAKVFGYPGNPPRKEHGGWATVRVRGPVDRRMIQLDVAGESAFLVQPGYSGSPVVVTDADGHDLVVAMLSAADADGAKDALAIRAAALVTADDVDADRRAGRGRIRDRGLGVSRVHRRRRLLVLAAGAVLAAVVVVAVAVWFAMGGHPASPAAVSPVGDPRTADPCALADPSALTRFGQTQLSGDQGNFDRCDVIVSPSNAAGIDVELQFLAPGQAPNAQPQDTATAGSVKIVRVPPQDGECDRYLLLPGGYSVDVSARPGSSPASLCAMADAATKPAVAELRKGTLPRRSEPVSSLARLDACAGLDARTLSRVVDAVASDHQAGFGNWTCRWSSGDSGLSVMLRYDQGDPQSENDGRHEKLSGRDAYVKPGGDGGDDCLVRVVNRHFVDDSGNAAEEVLYLVVDGHQPPPALCAPATALAADAAARLPRS